MATRSNIKVIVKDGEKERVLVCFYKHFDGYPQRTLRAMVEGFIKHKALGDRDIVGVLHEIFCEGKYFDAIQIIPTEDCGQMGEEYLYTIYVSEMSHKTDGGKITIKCLDVDTRKNTSVIIGTGEGRERIIVSGEQEYLKLISDEDDNQQDVF